MRKEIALLDFRPQASDLFLVRKPIHHRHSQQEGDEKVKSAKHRQKKRYKIEDKAAM